MTSSSTAVSILAAKLLAPGSSIYTGAVFVALDVDQYIHDIRIGPDLAVTWIQVHSDAHHRLVVIDDLHTPMALVRVVRAHTVSIPTVRALFEFVVILHVDIISYIPNGIQRSFCFFNPSSRARTRLSPANMTNIYK